MSAIEILEKLFEQAKNNLYAQKHKTYSEIITTHIDVLISAIDKNKSLISALTTSLLKKICNPEQNIRLHKQKFEGGYSARSLDTQVTVPFFKQHFPKYANKESGFLTLATRVDIPWNLSEESNIATQSKVLHNFLVILDAIENSQICPQDTLIYLFENLYSLSLKQEMIFKETFATSDFIEVININTVLQMLEKHFSSSQRGVSRLPVIAIYSIYQKLFKQIKRYENKILRPLNVHTSADRHGYGDIEIWNKDDTPFEMVEIKHNISIDRSLVFDVVKKSTPSGISRCYILTTAKNNFTTFEEEDYINKFILQIKKDANLEIIANGIFTSLKYYLRFIEDYKDFVKTYTQNLIADAKNSTEITQNHILEWQNILNKRRI